MKFVNVLQGKLLVAAIVSVALVGGATAVFAATPAGSAIVHSISHTHSSTTSTLDVSSHKNSRQNDSASHSNSCPGLPEAQQLAGKYALSTDSKGAVIQAICALHQGTFKGTTPSGTSVSSKRVFGYGEIDMLLTYAGYLASHDKANASSKLTSDNMLSYLAQALNSCGTTPLASCLKTNIPGYQPGKNNSNSDGTGNTSSHGSGNGSGKPTGTPTPSPHNH